MARTDRREFLKTAGGVGASSFVSALALRQAKASAPALAVGTAQLENGLVSFEFDEKTGSLRQITDRKTGRRYLNDSRGYRMAKLIVPTPEHNSRPLLSHEAGQPTISRRGDQLEIRRLFTSAEIHPYLDHLERTKFLAPPEPDLEIDDLEDETEAEPWPENPVLGAEELLRFSRLRQLLQP